MKCNSIDKDILYVLTTKGGEKFLGHTAALVNPCGDIWEPDSYRGGYVREGCDDLIPTDEIASAVRIAVIVLPRVATIGMQKRMIMSHSLLNIRWKDLWIRKVHSEECMGY